MKGVSKPRRRGNLLANFGIASWRLGATRNDIQRIKKGHDPLCVLFDAEYFMYSEETDFCYRTKVAGFKTFFFPGSEVIHYGGSSAIDQFHRLHQVHSSQFQFVRKHFTGIRKYASIWIKYIGIILRVFIYVIVGCLLLQRRYLTKSWYYWKILLSL